MIAAIFTEIIIEAYALKPILKKSADTILTRFDTMKGRVATSAIKPAAITNAVLTERIRQIHAELDQAYGMPRVRAELRDQGLTVTRLRVAHLMCKAGLRGVSRRRACVMTTRKAAHYSWNSCLRVA